MTHVWRSKAQGVYFVDQNNNNNNNNNLFIYNALFNMLGDQKRITTKMQVKIYMQVKNF